MVLGLGALACVPDVEIDESRLGAPRLLAVRAEPPEVAPGQVQRYVGLFAGADGVLDAAPLDWAYCLARKPLAELGPVSGACLEVEGDAIAPIGVGLAVEGALPRESCRLFGPEPPPTVPGEPIGRPVDPDVTGGYTQPLRLLVPDGAEIRPSLFEVRIACGLFGATQAESVAYTQRYRRNTAPGIEALELVHQDGRVVTLEPGATTSAPRGEQVTLRARWPACPDADACGDGLCGIDETRASCPDDCSDPAAVGCAGAERFLRFDLGTRALVADRESVRLAWYASDGSFEAARTGVSGDEALTLSENGLTLPEAPTELVVIVVLRDERGGATWREARLRVE
ncbi:MAG: hypothetical protein KF729_22200 [Sandaracinaceae bacterium]|nr:hypothetical protein [Sandaracinaceae bacterium]